jgi:hypothetical protein
LSDIELPPLHDNQQTVFDTLDDDSVRFVVVSAGRRFGKTLLGALKSATVAIPGGKVWWIAPSYGMGMVAWRELKSLTRTVPGRKVREAEKLISFSGTGSGDGFIQVKSADDPDKLRGEGLDFLVLDEFAHQRHAKYLWESSLQPALGERQGKALFISTPYGKNFFYTLYTYGEVDEQTGERNVEGWRSFQFPTSSNPYFPAEEFERAKTQQPLEVFEQEYLAIFNDSAGSVFRNIRNCIDTSLTPTPISDRNYVIGVDWGKQRDFTVFTVIDVERKALIRLDRFNKIDFSFQLGRLLTLCDLYKPSLVSVERNAAGEVITTLHSKAVIIEDLALAFEGGVISIPDPDRYENVARLLVELEAVRGTRTKTGIMSYKAPDHVHDDIVMSLAIAWHGIKEDKPPPMARIRSNYIYNG